MDDSTKTQPVESRAAKVLREVFESGRPLTYIRSSEERRVARVLRDVGRAIPPPHRCPFGPGASRRGCVARTARPSPAREDSRAVLDFIAAHKDACDFPPEGLSRTAAGISRRETSPSGPLRKLSRPTQVRGHHFPGPIHSGGSRADPLFFELRPPDLVELVGFLREEVQQISARDASADASEATLYQLASALQGLTLDEARHAVRRVLAAKRGLGAESLPSLLEEKRLLVNRSGVIQYVADSTSIGEVGGLEDLKRWLLERRKLFQRRDSVSTDIVPKGVLVMGIPGCGKSLCVKAIASYFELPLYRIDMIEIFSGRHGKPEGAFVQACKTLEDLAPAVLWFDEIEMGITSTRSGGSKAGSSHSS